MEESAREAMSGMEEIFVSNNERLLQATSMAQLDDVIKFIIQSCQQVV
jgi:hypothetical protein